MNDVGLLSKNREIRPLSLQSLHNRLNDAHGKVDLAFSSIGHVTMARCGIGSHHDEKIREAREACTEV